MTSAGHTRWATVTLLIWTDHIAQVHGFDLVAEAPGVTACNMADVPLPDGSVDAAIFCLALMGTDYGAFLRVSW